MLFADRREAEQFRRRHVCGLPDCRGELVTAWDGGENSYRVHCGVCKSGKVKPRRSLTARWLAGEVNVDIATANRLEAKLGAQPLNSQALMVLPEQQMIERVSKAGALGRFGTDKITPEQGRELAYFCQQHGLDPYAGEVCIYEGKPYAMIRAYERKAHEHPRYLAHPTEVVTDPGVKEGLGYKPTDVVARCEVYLKAAPKPVVAYGRANSAAPYRANPVEKAEPWVMAAKRASMRGLRAALGLEIPSYELYTEAAENVIDVEARIVDVNGQPVDVQTGEIVDAGPGLGDEEPDEAPRSHLEQWPLDDLAKLYAGDNPKRQKVVLDWLRLRGVASVLDASEADRIALRAELIRRIALRPVRLQP